LNVVAIEELMWTYHPLPKEWITVPFADTDSIENADVLVQSNQKGSKKEKKIGHIYDYVLKSGKPFNMTESAAMKIVLVIDGNKFNEIKKLKLKTYFKRR